MGIRAVPRKDYMRASGTSELIACLGLLGGSWPLWEAEYMQGRVLVVLAPEEPSV